MATLTLTFTAPNATRLQNALKESLELETVGIADLKAYIIQDLKQLVRSSEKRVSRLAEEEVAPPVIT